VKRYCVALLVVGLFPQMLTAQAPKSPYTGEEKREIKSLSGEEVAMYLAGAGMGLAKAAELNRYPGPMHVLELALELELSGDQRTQTEQLFAETKAEARRLGEEIVALERELDERFSSEQISETELARLVKDIGSKKAELRLVHLRAHVRQRALLSSDQTARYVTLRGYDDHHHHNAGKHLTDE
jgi:hypothetical protein